MKLEQEVFYGNGECKEFDAHEVETKKDKE